MSDPWAPFPLPTRGDDEERLTFEGVGRVMTAWEAIEFQLSRFYSIFAGDPDGASMRDYGKPRIFRDRLDGVRRVADRRFTALPNQMVEGKFDQLTAHAEGFSERRNEVAHGFVFRIDRITFFKERFEKDVGNKPQYALIPPYYALRSHTPEGLPLYAYTHAECAGTEADYPIGGLWWLPVRSSLEGLRSAVRTALTMLRAA